MWMDGSIYREEMFLDVSIEEKKKLICQRLAEWWYSMYMDIFTF